jgi:hypothetical protein
VRKWLLFLPLVFYELLFIMLPEMVNEAYTEHLKRKAARRA